jgi:hypothetical protein
MGSYTLDLSACCCGADIPCSECFGAGTPHPTDATPATVTADFNSGEYTQPFVNDGNWDYQAGPTVIPGVLNMSIHLCASFCYLPEDPPGACLIINLFPDPAEAVPLTITSCDPFVATGSSSFGTVVVTE